MTYVDAAPEPVTTGEPILSVTNLKKYFPVRGSGVMGRVVAQVQAVDDVSFTIRTKGKPLVGTA